MTARPMEEGRLLLCPFCGGNASRHDLTDAENAGGSCIACDRCGASSPVHFDRKENLDDSWNRRHLSAEVKGLREALEKIQGYCERRMSPPSFATHGKHIVPIVLAALSPIPTQVDEQARATRSAPTDSLSQDTTTRLAVDWRTDIENMPRDGTPFFAVWPYTVRWKAYKPGSPQFAKGIAGRWQKANGYGGWDNCEEPCGFSLAAPSSTLSKDTSK